MGTELFKGFGVDIAAEILKGLGPGFPDATLIARTLGAIDPLDLTAGQPIIETPHSCKAMLDTYDQRRMGESTIQQGSRIVLILGNSLPTGTVPNTDDRIVAEGQTFHLVGPVQRDPAGATYLCEVRA